MLGKVGVVVAARSQSVRLPGKALLPLQGIPMIQFLLRRLQPMQNGMLAVATTDLAADDELAAAVIAAGIPLFRGSSDDVVGRYVGAAKRFGFDTVARVTGDCPFVDAELTDWCIARASALDSFDLATTKGRFPVGLDVEIYRSERMADLDTRRLLTPADREHLTLYFYDHSDELVLRTIEQPAGWPKTSGRFTVDTPADYDRAQALAARFDRPNFSIRALLTAAA
jgi:spore coat polysaccharide biosynthesis protein SpsF